MLKDIKLTGGKLSRRTLLKIGALTTASLGAPAASLTASDSERLFDSEIRSCCQFCQVRCTTLVQVKNKQVVNVYGNPDNYWTEGGMCPKGQSMVELTYSPHRILHPLKREGNGWKRISYQEAVDIVADKILKTKAESPEDYTNQVVMFAPLWESHESDIAASMAMKLAGFPDIYHPGDTCIGNSGLALQVCLGSGITPTTLDETLNSQSLILWGVNVAETYPLYRSQKNSHKQSLRRAIAAKAWNRRRPSPWDDSISDSGKSLRCEICRKARQWFQRTCRSM
jgi:formate dehydrogenase major subunit